MDYDYYAKKRKIIWFSFAVETSHDPLFVVHKGVRPLSHGSGSVVRLIMCQFFTTQWNNEQLQHYGSITHV